MKLQSPTVCCEISYGEVHSDLCPPHHNYDPNNLEYRKLMHTVLEEWLEKSMGEGIFYVGDSNYFNKET